MAQKARSKSVPVAPPAEGRLARFGRKREAFLAASALLLIPCAWHSRLQAGDLGSHIYNAWLGQLIREGRAPGLSIVFQSSNVLFDLILSSLFRAFGAGAAQHIAVAAAVLIFAWGAFAFVSTVAQRRAWDALPAIAILAYGWVFHMGLFNFYLGVGLCFWGLAAAWRGRVLAAIPIFTLACAAHELAVAWAVALLAYRWIAERTPAPRRVYLAIAAVAALIALHVAMAALFQVRWLSDQIFHTTGADQADVYDAKYVIVALGMAAIWGWQILSARKTLPPIFAQMSLLTAAGILIVPTWAWLPQYQHALVFISQRMSIAMGVCVAGLAAVAPAARWQRYSAIAAALLFFAFLYRDEGVLNAFEDQLEAAVAPLPAGSRVVSAIQAPQLRTNAIDHMIDRVCINHCWSYANYEPSSGAFRIRVTGPTTIVAPTDMDSSRMQNGGYAVKPRDLPLYRLQLNADGNIVVQEMPAGALIGASYWNGL
jgi:hypothetical protein